MALSPRSALLLRTFLIFCLLDDFNCPAFAQGFKVTSPKYFDVLSDNSRWNITWTVHSTDLVTISLVRGADAANPVQATTLAVSVNNTGDWLWRPDQDPDFYLWHEYPSGCDYAMQLRAGDDLARSDLFTFLNGENATYPKDACPNSTAGVTFYGNGTQISDDKNSALPNPNTSTSSSSRHISPATLGGAIAAVVIGLLALLATLIIFLRKKGSRLLVSKRYLDRYASVTQTEAAVAVGKNGRSPPPQPPDDQDLGMTKRVQEEKGAVEEEVLYQPVVNTAAVQLPTDGNGRHQLPAESNGRYQLP